VQPDMLVENKPEDTLAGRDRQLQAAVEELMKQLNGSRKNTATEQQQR
jgi:C-terminal processing protease CtpA/Prc